MMFWPYGGGMDGDRRGWFDVAPCLRSVLVAETSRRRFLDTARAQTHEGTYAVLLSHNLLSLDGEWDLASHWRRISGEEDSPCTFNFVMQEN